MISLLYYVYKHAHSSVFSWAWCWGLMVTSVGLFHTTPSHEVTIGFMAKPIHNVSGTWWVWLSSYASQSSARYYLMMNVMEGSYRPTGDCHEAPSPGWTEEWRHCLTVCVHACIHSMLVLSSTLADFDYSYLLKPNMIDVEIKFIWYGCHTREFWLSWASLFNLCLSHPGSLMATGSLSCTPLCFDHSDVFRSC